MGIILNRRRIMGGNKLPYDYEVEWIGADNNQYIDTGINADNKLGIETEFAIINLNNPCGFGALRRYGNSISDYTYTRYHTLYQASGPFSGSYIWIKDVYYNMNITDNNFHSLLCNLSDLAVTVDGNRFSITSPGSFNVNLSFYLFGRHTNYSPTSSNCKIKMCKMYYNGVIVRDFIPVVKDNIGYMYDKVSGQLFANAGTGSFILGPDKDSTVIITQQQQREMYGE